MYRDIRYSWDEIALLDRIGDNKLYHYDNNSSHIHSDYEIYYLFYGENDYSVNDHKFHVLSDNLLLIPPNCTHCWKYPNGKLQQSKNLHFSSDLLNDTEHELINQIFKVPMLIPNQFRLNYNSFFQAIIDCEKLPANLRKVSMKNMLISFLVQSYLMNSKQNDKPLFADERIEKVATYINANLTQKISLNILADKFGVTKNYLSAQFNSIMGIPVTKYVNLKRLEFVKKSVISGSSIGEAAFNAGFIDYSTFYRAYKSIYNCPPSEMFIIQSENSGKSNNL